MPWVPELFSTPALERLTQKRRQEKLEMVSYFDGLLASEPEALVGSFAGVPELHAPIRGRVKGRGAFEAFVEEETSWLRDFNVSVEDVGSVVTKRSVFGEVILHIEGEAGRIDQPVAGIADRRPDRRLEELRLYSSHWPLTGRHTNRSPLLQPDAGLQASDVVGEYQRALAAGDVDAIVATFESDGYAREPAGGRHVHRGHDQLRAFYARLFSNGGGIPLEHCAVVDDGRACVLEYNVVRWGEAELPPQAGAAVYVRGESGRLAAARIYDDVDPPPVTAS
jgi:SnoaL-like domain